MTTNNPTMIDPRIKSRPGRVDRIFEIDNLQNEYALKCGAIYFQNILDYDINDRSDEAAAYFSSFMGILNNMSGASIKCLAHSTKLYAAGNNLPITLDLITKVKTKMLEDLSKIDKYAEDDSNTQPVGFATKNIIPLVQIKWEIVDDQF